MNLMYCSNRFSKIYRGHKMNRVLRWNFRANLITLSCDTVMGGFLCCSLALMLVFIFSNSSISLHLHAYMFTSELYPSSWVKRWSKWWRRRWAERNKDGSVKLNRRRQWEWDGKIPPPPLLGFKALTASDHENGT